jgi:hypothetical protein
MDGANGAPGSHEFAGEMEIFSASAEVFFFIPAKSAP